MVLHLYAVRDVKARVYMTPFFQRSAVEAVRTFSGAVNDATTVLSKYSDDFELFELGSFEDDSAAFTLHNEPLFVVSAKSVRAD